MIIYHPSDTVTKMLARLQCENKDMSSTFFEWLMMTVAREAIEQQRDADDAKAALEQELREYRLLEPLRTG